MDLISGKVRRDDYRRRENPPILHRKETFLPADHPLHSKFARLTREEEKAGLPPVPQAAPAQEHAPAPVPPGEVVSLDAFRRRPNKDGG